MSIEMKLKGLAIAMIASAGCATDAETTSEDQADVTCAPSELPAGEGTQWQQAAPGVFLYEARDAGGRHERIYTCGGVAARDWVIENHVRPRLAELELAGADHGDVFRTQRADSYRQLLHGYDQQTALEAATSECWGSIQAYVDFGDGLVVARANVRGNEWNEAESTTYSNGGPTSYRRDGGWNRYVSANQARSGFYGCGGTAWGWACGIGVWDSRESYNCGR